VYSAGRWVSTRMSLQQLSSKDDSSAPASSTATSPVLPVKTAPTSVPPNPSALGDPVPRVGDEIMVCGRLYHTGTPVILWSDVGGYDHYRVERRYCPIDEASWATTQQEVPTFTTPNRFGLRKNGLTDAQVEAVRGGQWDLPTLQTQVKQLVLHYDEEGLSRSCFETLQDVRDLSIHFMLDLDGTIYQNLDLKERAWQATTANTNSCGVEIANVGAFDPAGPNPFADWYGKDSGGNTIITIPAQYGDGGIHTPNFVGSPARPTPIPGNIQGLNLIQFDYTPQQYASLAKLIAAYCTIFPSIPPTYPKDSQGNLITVKLPDATLATYTGILGHYHIQTNKIDPGPAMQWGILEQQAKMIMEESKKAKDAINNASSKQSTVTAAASIESNESCQSDKAEKLAHRMFMRKLERKVFAAAEESAAASLSPSDKYYLIESEWYNSWRRWLSVGGNAVGAPRPTAVTNLILLESDERTPRVGLTCPTNYRSVHARVWADIVDVYGADATIVRSTPDIYTNTVFKQNGVAPNNTNAPAAPTIVTTPLVDSTNSVVASVNVNSPPAVSTFAVPIIQNEADDPWILVTK
jgi:N-acetylmuramoyl-L-alanine amidase